MSLSAPHASLLMDVARHSIKHGVEHGHALVVDADTLAAPLQAIRSTFVTLHLEGKLRGCMGGLKARIPLICDVAEHAYMAAFKDPRFSPVNRAELSRLDLHLSILTPQTVINFIDEEDLVRQLRPGIDGLVISRAQYRATFLPSVWASLPSPSGFLNQLKAKAGISADDTPTNAWRYTVDAIPG